MGLFWNFAAAFFVAAVVPVRAFSAFQPAFVMLVSVSVAAAVVAEQRRIVRPD